MINLIIKNLKYVKIGLVVLILLLAINYLRGCKVVDNLEDKSASNDEEVKLLNQKIKEGEEIIEYSRFRIAELDRQLAELDGTLVKEDKELILINTEKHENIKRFDTISTSELQNFFTEWDRHYRNQTGLPDCRERGKSSH